MVIADQQRSQIVQANLRKARARYASDPVAALKLLRETLLQVWEDPDISERARDDLLDQVVAGRLQLTREGRKAAWNLDFRFKAPRLVVVDVPGQGRKTIWYWQYEVVNKTRESHPFVPAFELVSNNRVHRDTIIPGAQEAVRRLEDPARLLDLKNSVTIATQPVPPSKWAARKVFGLAFFDGVSSNARSFTIFVSGLSSAWSSDGESVRRKVLKCSFKRVDMEMVQAGAVEWVYRSYPVKRQEDGENPQAEIQRLIRQLRERIADLEEDRTIWKEQRQHCQDQIRELRHRAEHLPADLKGEDRVAAVRDTSRRIKDLKQQISEGDRKERSRHLAAEAYRQRLDELWRKSEIDKMKRTIAGLERQRQASRKEKEQLQAMIASWQKVMAQSADTTPARRKEQQTLLKELKRQLESGDGGDRLRQTELELLNNKLKALEQAGS
jgi:hypothetical protein